jgi:hypothetical protein
MERVGDSPRNTPTPPPETERVELMFTTGSPLRRLSPHDVTAPIGNAVQRVGEVAGKFMAPVFSALLETREVVESAHAAITNAPGALAVAVSSSANSAANATFKIVTEGASQMTNSALNLASAGASTALGFADRYVAGPVLDRTTRAYFGNQRKEKEYAQLQKKPDPKLSETEVEEDDLVSIDFQCTRNLDDEKSEPPTESLRSEGPLSTIAEEHDAPQLDESKSKE